MLATEAAMLESLSRHDRAALAGLLTKLAASLEQTRDSSATA
jgi:hypothetical protein